VPPLNGRPLIPDPCFLGDPPPQKRSPSNTAARCRRLLRRLLQLTEVFGARSGRSPSERSSKASSGGSISFAFSLQIAQRPVRRWWWPLLAGLPPFPVRPEPLTGRLAAQRASSCCQPLTFQSTSAVRSRAEAGNYQAVLHGEGAGGSSRLGLVALAVAFCFAFWVGVFLLVAYLT